MTVKKETTYWRRRTFLATAALTGAVSCTHSPNSAGWRVLSDPEALTLGAWVECLIPADQDPGARDAGVVRFIDNQLASRFHSKLPLWRSMLSNLNRASALLHSKPFADLEMETQTSLLSLMEKGNAPKEAFPEDGGKAAFEAVLSFAMMGFYGNPRHGGNQGYASWKMLGIPPIPIRGRQRIAPETSPKGASGQANSPGGSL